MCAETRDKVPTTQRTKRRRRMSTQMLSFVEFRTARSTVSEEIVCDFWLWCNVWVMELTDLLPNFGDTSWQTTSELKSHRVTAQFCTCNSRFFVVDTRGRAKFDGIDLFVIRQCCRDIFHACHRIILVRRNVKTTFTLSEEGRALFHDMHSLDGFQSVVVWLLLCLQLNLLQSWNRLMRACETSLLVVDVWSILTAALT